MLSCKKIIITGPTAVGKSTILQSIHKCLNSLFVPEYIDGRKDGLTMLNKYFTKAITSYDFQSYILDYYDNKLSALHPTKSDSILFERAPDDAITCYSNMDNRDGRLSNKEFLSLYNKAKTLDLKYNIPSYLLGNSFVFTPVKSVDTKNTSKMMLSIIKSTKQSNVFGLYHATNVLWYRMTKRNRPGEKETYSHETLSDFNKHYRKLYMNMMYKRGLRFATLGTLV